MINESRQTAFVLLVIAALVAAFWWPTLVGDKSVVHGDSLVHGLPLMDLHARALHGDASLLWSNQVYGGHPLFAEGQGAFAHPLNILLALLVSPVYGHNLLHFFSMLLMAVGTFGLCRSLGTSALAAGFAALAASFATTNIGAQQNMTISGAIAWVPWVLWALELWLKRPTPFYGVLLASACALVILAGYPQVFHGLVIYMAVSLVSVLLTGEERQRTLSHWRSYLSSGALAVVLCCGLAAVQLVPLFELTRWSHRAEGVGLIPYMPLDANLFWRGFFFTLTALDQPPEGYIPVVGSVLVCTLAVLVPLFRTSARVKGHLLATLLLLQIGIGIASPVFRVVYDYHLVPGLSFFRTMSVYLNLVSVTVAVLAAVAIDALGNHLVSTSRHALWRNWIIYAVLGVFALFGWFAWRLYSDVIPVWNGVALGLALLAVLVQAGITRRRVLAGALLALIAFECVTLHLHEFHFGEAALLRNVRQVSVDRLLPDVQDYRFLDRSLRARYAFANARHPDLEYHARRLLAANSAMTNLMLGTASIHGALALPLKPRALLDDVFQAESDGQSQAPPGQRAIDLLAIRYITVNSPEHLPAFPLAKFDETTDTAVMENSSARPRFQTYTRHVTVQTPEQAVAMIRSARDEALIIEADPAEWQGRESGANSSDALRFVARKATAMRYEFDVDADRDGWLFVADANYPGWKARVDGIDSRVYSANVLGKAIAVPQGQHRVELYFESATFRIGLIGTVLSLLIAAGVIVMHIRTRQHPDAKPLKDQFPKGAA